MSAVERAKEDLTRGDHWLARQRVASYLATKGYDPELLIFLGQICYDMHDAYEAGRYWLASTAEGEHVEQAIETFIRHKGGQPGGIAAALPSFVKWAPRESYPPVVQERLRRAGIDKAIPYPPRPRTGGERRTVLGKVATVLGVLLLLFLAASLVVGAVVLISGAFSVINDLACSPPVE